MYVQLVVLFEICCVRANSCCEKTELDSEMHFIDLFDFLSSNKKEKLKTSLRICDAYNKKEPHHC